MHSGDPRGARQDTQSRWMLAWSKFTTPAFAGAIATSAGRQVQFSLAATGSGNFCLLLFPNHAVSPLNLCAVLRQFSVLSGKILGKNFVAFNSPLRLGGLAADVFDRKGRTGLAD